MHAAGHSPHPRQDEPTDPLSLAWQRVLHLYDHPGVSQACLLLQNEASVDVMVLLFAIDLATEQNIALSDPAIAEADNAVASWRSRMILSLRALRTDCTGKNELKSLRKALLEAELQAERCSLRLLMEAFDRSRTNETGSSENMISRIVRFYSKAAARPELNISIDCLQRLVTTR